MAYIKQKNTEVIVCSEGGTPIQGTANELSSHGSVISGLHEVVDESLPNEIKQRLIYVSPEA